MSLDRFEDSARLAFAFLEHDFGCTFLVESEKERRRHWWARYLTYRNDATFVRVELDDRDHAFNVLFGPLVDEEIPEYPIFLPASGEDVRWFPLWAVMEARGEDAPPFSWDDAALDAELQAWANALREHAGPALEGRFAGLEAVYPVLSSNLERRQRELDEELAGDG